MNKIIIFCSLFVTLCIALFFVFSGDEEVVIENNLTLEQWVIPMDDGDSTTFEQVVGEMDFSGNVSEYNLTEEELNERCL